MSLKAKLMQQPILQFPDFTREFVLTTDASNQGLGAVQSQGPVGRDLPVAYASRSLNYAELHYSTSEKELLSVVWAVKYLRQYLYGQKFTIVTDHRPLVWIMNVKDPGSRLTRWRIQLAEYDYKIVHKSGSQNANANALGRIRRVGVLEKHREVTDEKVKHQILYEYHDAPVGGHRGMNKTYRAISSQYTCPNMKREVENYVRQCKSCHVNKILTPKHRAPLQITTTAERPFEKCYLDIVGPLPVTSQGHKYILTFQDDLSKYVVAIPVEKQDAETTARAFVEKIVLTHGPHKFCKRIRGLTL